MVLPGDLHDLRNIGGSTRAVDACAALRHTLVGGRGVSLPRRHVRPPRRRQVLPAATAAARVAAVVEALTVPTAVADRAWNRGVQRSLAASVIPGKAEELPEVSAGRAIGQEATAAVAAADVVGRLHWPKCSAWIRPNVVAAGSSFLTLSVSVANAARALNTSVSARIPGVPMKSMAKIMAVCFCCVVLYGIISSLDYNSKKLDIRRVWGLKTLLRRVGYDEFDAFGVRVTVHSVQDVQAQGMFGGALKYQVIIRFFWSSFSTAVTDDMRWEQTKGMDVPQGAAECYIGLVSVGRVRNSTVAEFCYETKYHMLDKYDFWNKKQKVKLAKNGKYVGTLLITFRQKGDDDDEDMPIAGIDEDSSLAMEVVKAYEELCDQPGFVKPQGKWEGQEKLALLGMVLQGNLREITPEGKDAGKVFIKVTYCNFAELQGKKMAKEMQRQKEKAASKGLTEIERKWYWVWYGSEKEANDENKWHFPDGFFPITAVSSVNRTPDRDDQFVLKYYGGDRDFIIYRRDQGKGLDTWVDGLEMHASEVRDRIKELKKAEEQLKVALPKMREMHKAFVAKNGMPSSSDEWTEWHDYFETNNYKENQIKILYGEVATATVT